MLPFALVACLHGSPPNSVAPEARSAPAPADDPALTVIPGTPSPGPLLLPEGPPPTLPGIVRPMPWLPATEPWRSFRDQAVDDRARIWGRLAELCDLAGHRLAGSEGLKRAEAITRAWFEADGVKVTLEPAMVPVWVRGEAALTLLTPFAQPLDLLALGGSVATPKGGIEAEVVVIHEFAELSDAVKGKIVLYNHPMKEGVPAIDHYGDAVQFRGAGASKAAAFGAVAVLVRSVTTRSLYTPHTGALNYDESVPRIPAAAITVEDAERIERLSARGPVRVRLALSPRTLADAEAFNVVAELPGSELANEIVVVGGHLDSWDVGQGAHDDGAGVVEAVEALRLIKSKGTPRRTVRAVLFTNEENGLRGGKAYFTAHGGERHVAAVETDLGGGFPRGWGIEADEVQRAWIDPLIEGSAMWTRGDGGGADISPLVEDGVLGIGLIPDDSHYFDFHHTRADTPDKVDPEALANGTAAIAGLVWQLASAPDAPPKAARRGGD